MMSATVGANEASRPAAATKASKPPTAQEMQDRFLTLLVTQMKNQDPLNPMDNAQLTTQLAQISTVTGIDGVNATMKSVLEQIGALQQMQAVGMAGREVVATGNRISLGSEGSGAYLFDLPASIDGATVTIKNSSGAVVRTIQTGALGAGMQTREWDGKTEAGARVPAGVYSFTVDAQATGKPAEATTYSRARVEGIIRGADGVQLNLGPLGTRPMSDVKQIM